MLCKYCQEVAISTFAFSKFLDFFPNIFNVKLVESIHVKLADTDMEG